MKFTEEELEKIKKERMKQIDRWLDNEYGCSYTRLEELHDFAIEQDMKHQEEKDKEIERLTAESTKWESKFYDEAKKVDKAIEFIEKSWNDKCTIPLEEVGYSTDNRWEIWKILKGSDKE